jgi:hypothetical protein
MKGFDRPLKPQWIYNIIKLLKVGDIIYKQRDKLDEILVELDGKTGKRKVITVIGRYFLKNPDNPRGKKVEDNLIFNLVKNSSYEEAKPLMLFNILVKSPLLQHLSKQLLTYYRVRDIIDSNFLRNKIYRKVGERDIARRSLRNFFSTLVDFGILKRQARTNYLWEDKIKIDEACLINFFKLYSKYYLNSPQISLYGLPEHLFFYFDIPDVYKVAQKYNNVHWQYVRRVNAAIITLK